MELPAERPKSEVSIPDRIMGSEITRLHHRGFAARWERGTDQEDNDKL